MSRVEGRTQDVRIDLHVHTRHSHDARGSVLEAARHAVARGLAGFAVTDHNTTAGHRDAKAAAKATGLLVIPACEVSSLEGHILCFGITGKPPQGRPAWEVLSWAEDQGGIGVPSHPLRVWTGLGPTDLSELVAQARIEAIEAVNGRDRGLVRRNVEALAQRLGLATIGGSDAHHAQDVGACWTSFESDTETVEDVVEAIRRGRCVGRGGHIPRLHVWRHRAAMLVGKA